jgi:pyruvate kinase
MGAVARGRYGARRRGSDRVTEFHATLGPQSLAEPALRTLLQAGVTALRVNLSHSDGATAVSQLRRARALAAELGLRVALGADLRGRKLRSGRLEGSAPTLHAGQDFDLRPVAVDAEGASSAAETTVNCPGLERSVGPGTIILLDDGALRLRVLEVAPGRLRCIVEQGGPLGARVGVNLPGTPLALPPLTAKDLADLDALASLPPDHVYLSFVERASDLAVLRQALAERGLRSRVVAKLERAAAFDALDAIGHAADALCLARGDLGVEVGLARVPRCQRALAEAARRCGTPWLLAGEILLTTLHRSQPSRAELTDLQVAVDQGAAGFVLSDETALGPDPAAALRWLIRLVHDMA